MPYVMPLSPEEYNVGSIDFEGRIMSILKQHSPSSLNLAEIKRDLAMRLLLKLDDEDVLLPLAALETAGAI